MDGVEKVFLLAGPHEGEVQSNRSAIDAARDSGVDLLVRSSVLGSDPGSRATFIRNHGANDRPPPAGVERPFVILRPNLFLQNVPQNSIPSIGSDVNLYVNAGDARISMVDARDVAAVAAVVLTEPGHEGTAYDVTGPEALSYHEIAAMLSATLGHPISYVDAPDEAVRHALGSYGRGAWEVNALIELYQDYRRSGAHDYAAEVTNTVEELTGRRALSLNQLLLELPSTTLP